MIDQSLITFFKECVARGISREKIFEMAKEKGWRQNDMEEAFVMSGVSAPERLLRIEARLEQQAGRLEVLEKKILGEAQASPVVFPSLAQKEIIPPEKQGAAAQRGQESETDWEHILGGNWLVKIGIAALALGIGFFFKLAIDNNWINEVTRIFIGLAAGFSLIGAGEYWRKKYSLYAQILTGGGIVILYFSVYGAHAFYDLIGALSAFWLMALITLAAGLLALRYGQPTIALIGILGGFFTPFMFLKAVQEETLIIYTIILDLGILVLSSVRNWRPLTLVGLIGSVFLYFYWHAEFFTQTKFWIAEGYITAVFLIFSFATILWHFLWKKIAQQDDLALMTLNAACYFVLSYSLLKKDYEDWMGVFAFALSLFYGFLAYVARSRADKNFQLTLFLGGISLVFLTLAIPLQFEDQWITIGWTVEAVLLVAAGFLVSHVYLRSAGLIALTLVAIRLVTFETQLPKVRDFIPLFNERFFAFAVGVIAMFFVAYMYSRWKERVEKFEEGVFPAVLLAANFFTLWILSAETLRYFDMRIEALGSSYSAISQISNLEHAKNFALSAMWTVYSILLVITGIFKRVRILRVAGLMLFWITILKVFAMDLFGIGGIFRVGSLISLGVILLATGYLYHRFSARIKEFLTVENQEKNG